MITPKGGKPLLHDRWEKCAKTMVYEGCTGAAAWRKTALSPPTTRQCAQASVRMRSNVDFQDRIKYLKAHPQEADIDASRNYEKLEGRLWAIIESSGTNASKDNDVIRAIAELAKLRERMLQGEQAAADNAVIATTLTRILTNGIEAICPDDSTLDEFVEAFSKVIKRSVSIQSGSGEFITYEYEEGKKNGGASKARGLVEEGQPEGERDDTAEGVGLAGE